MANPRKRKAGGVLARLHKKFYSSSVTGFGAGGAAATKAEQAYTDTQVDAGKEYLLDMLMLSDYMYDGPKRPFTNGDQVLLSELKARVSSWESTGTAMGAGDALLSGLSDSDIAEAATANLTCADGDDNTASQFTDGEYMLLTDTAGTTRVYVLCDNSAGFSGATGDVITTSDTVGGTGTLSSVTAALGTCIAVSNNHSSHSQALIVNEIKAAAVIGHAGTITFGDDVAATNGAKTIVMTQATAGSDGNTVITSNISQLSGGSTYFVGGVAAVAAAGTHALHFLDERASDTAGGGTVITDDTGILFDPAGPAVKYHQDFQGISLNGTATYMTILPASWASGKSLNLSLYGALADGDSMRVHGLSGSTLTNITGMSANTGSAATSQRAGSSGSAPIDMNAALDYDAATNIHGICVTWRCPANTDGTTTSRLPWSGSLQDDGSTLSVGDASGSTGLGFALSWNVSSGSTS